MDSTEQCKHSRIKRNCYACHVDYIEPKNKTELDTLHETISELKVRVSKLEQYARLQADHNNLQREINTTLDNYIRELREHRAKQIDENRAVSKHLSEIDVRLYKIEKPRITFDPGIWDTTAVRFVGSVSPPEQTLCMDNFTNPTPITFDEAFKAFMALKTIKRKNGVRYILQDQSFTTFSPDDILATDWEICG